MVIERPEFPSPVLILDDFLSEKDAARCLQECLDLKPVFMPSRVGAGRDNRADPNIRTNEVVHLDTVFGAARERSAILTLIDQRVRSRECNAIWHKGEFLFDIVNFATWRESVLSRYSGAEFYGKHQDTVFDRDHPEYITRRLVSFCYYMNREPKRFMGGEIVLYKNGEELQIAPRHNRAIVFTSFTHHEVRKVELADKEWDSGRFSLNYWMGFKG